MLASAAHLVRYPTSPTRHDILGFASGNIQLQIHVTYTVYGLLIIDIPVLVPADVEAEDLVHVDALVVEEVGRELAVRVLLGEVL